jgi:hypothetical protein
VLFVIDTVVSGQRLLQIAPLFDADPRVQVLCTMPEGGVYNDGRAELIANAGIGLVPWRQACEYSFDLAIAAGHEGIHELHSKLMLVQHGASFNKPVSAGQYGARVVGERATYGLGAQWLMRDGVLLPEMVALSHRDERTRLARWCPQALSRAVVVGDPCYDTLLASLPNRSAYRKALGAAGRQVVVLSSTWGPQSLLGSALELFERFAAELDPERFLIAALVHPAAWFGHGPWQIRAWLAEAIRHGLVLIPPFADWLGVLVASDIVVGDHGSATLYATATEARVVFGCRPKVDPESPVAELATVAPRINPSRPLAPQLRRLTPEFRREGYARIAARITSVPGRFDRIMRTRLYRLLGIPQPARLTPRRPAALPVLSEIAAR